MSNSTKIRFKRTAEQLNNIKFQDHSIDFGEPIFIDNNTLNKSGKCSSYIALGSNVENGQVKHAALFKGFWDLTKANSLVFYKGDHEGLIDEDNNPVFADKIITEQITEGQAQSSIKYFLLCQPDVPNTDPNYRSVKTFNMGDNGIYISSRGVLYGAAWNDYAEKREIVDNAIPGDVVCENGDGTLVLSSERLQACPYVVSDTFGIVIGDADYTPVAVAGRVLVKIHDENCSVGDCVCAGINGEATIMTRDEIKEFPDRVLGVITEIPEYEEWNGVKVNNRVWIKIR